LFVLLYFIRHVHKFSPRDLASARLNSIASFKSSSMSADGSDEGGGIPFPRPVLGDTDPGLPVADLMRGFFHAEVDATDLTECGHAEVDL
jgi:hypothetical protein